MTKCIDKYTGKRTHIITCTGLLIDFSLCIELHVAHIQPNFEEVAHTTTKVEEAYFKGKATVIINSSSR